MSPDHPFARFLSRHGSVAVLGYAVAVALLVFVAWVAIAGVFERHATVAAAQTMLNQLEGRRPGPPGSPTSAGGPVPTGSPFLEGQTVTVAGASLLQRVAGTITRLGGNVLSSQVDLQGSQAKNGFVSLIASCEITQAALQQMLHDLEAGMPFLFIDQIVVQAPTTSAGTDGGRLRVLLTVSGQWQGGK